MRLLHWWPTSFQPWVWWFEASSPLDKCSTSVLPMEQWIEVFRPLDWWLSLVFLLLDRCSKLFDHYIDGPLPSFIGSSICDISIVRSMIHHHTSDVGSIMFMYSFLDDAHHFFCWIGDMMLPFWDQLSACIFSIIRPSILEFSLFRSTIHVLSLDVG